MKRPLILAFAALCLILSSCQNNRGWDGHDSKAKPDVLAQESCGCIYEIMESDPELDVDVIVSEMEAYKKHQESGAPGSIAEKFPEIGKALMNMQKITEMVDGSPCMEGVDEKALGQGVPIEDVLDALDKHCALAIFYN